MALPTQPASTPGGSPSDALFTTPRERRLWLWTLAAIAGIYSTLGLAPSLAEAIASQRLIAGGFLLSMILIGIAVLTQGLTRRPGGTEIGVALGLVAVYLLVLIRMAVPPTERTHLIEYTVVALLIYEALSERRGHGGRVPFPPLLALAATAVLGVIDEVIQWFLPQRVFDPIDILFNCLAALGAVLASVALAWARNRVDHRRAAGSS